VRDLGLDTAVSGLNGHYSATLSEGWEVWGPQGGYVAAVALRGAAAAASFRRPASFASHFLRPAQIGPIDVRVESLTRTRRAESLRVTLFQDGVAVLEALVWTVGELVGIDHDAGVSPKVPGPDQLQPWEAYLPGGELPFAFWRNFDVRPVAPDPSRWGFAPDPSQPGRATEPRSVAWSRLRVRPALEDPFVDAARLLVIADSAMYPAATFAHDEPFPYIAPSLDLVLSFHRAAADSEWLLVEAISPLSEGALVAGNAAIWSSDGRLLATAIQQMLQRTDQSGSR
jgi:acyl-CoA thioesterase II